MRQPWPGAVRCSTLICLISLLAACAAPPREAADTLRAATGIPAATPIPPAAGRAAMSMPPATIVPRLAENVRVAGVDVSGLTLDVAATRVRADLAALFLPLNVQAGTVEQLIKPEAIDLEVALAAMLNAALHEGSGARVGLEVSYDQAKLRQLLEQLAVQAATPPGVSLHTAEGAAPEFVVTPGSQLNITAALAEIGQRLRAPASPRRVTLPMEPSLDGQRRPDPALIQQQLEAVAASWDGIAGVYLYDLADDREIAGVHAHTVFSAASVMKAAIQLYAYTQLGAFTPEEENWLEQMITYSRNLPANYMLAAGAGGSSASDAVRGVGAMTDMLRELGLEHTYMLGPYLDPAYPVAGSAGPPGPEQEGAEPFTVANRYLRTTPAEIAQVFLWIERCRQGRGPLLDRYANLTPDRCAEMLARMERVTDQSRMMAGLPEGTQVAHKGGWIDDVEADVGIVRSPGGDYLMAVYLFQAPWIRQAQAAATIAECNRLVYSYYNPLSAAEAQLRGLSQP